MDHLDYAELLGDIVSSLQSAAGDLTLASVLAPGSLGRDLGVIGSAVEAELTAFVAAVDRDDRR